MKGRLTFFGTGSSIGVPVIGCTCNVCLSDSPLNQRTRAAALLQVQDQNILLDVGPDFRFQALKHRLTKLDGLILTHTHYDHIAGIDDLRVFPFMTKKPLPILLSQATMEELEKRWFYLVKPQKLPKVECLLLEGKEGKTSFLGIPISYCSYQQTGMEVTGYRFGDCAFITDIKEYPQSIIGVLSGCETLIISTVDWVPTKAHLGVEEVIEFAHAIGVHRVVLTHIGHELDHESTNAKLPKFMELAYDGMSIECNL